MEAQETGDWSPVDRFLEEQGDKIAARVAVPMAFGDSPWSPFKKRLSESKVAVMTTGGVYVEGQQPFDTGGDWSFREIPLDTPLDQLRVAHTHYDTTGVAEDVDAVLAMHRLLRNGFGKLRHLWERSGVPRQVHRYAVGCAHLKSQRLHGGVVAAKGANRRVAHRQLIAGQEGNNITQGSLVFGVAGAKATGCWVACGPPLQKGGWGDFCAALSQLGS